MKNIERDEILRTLSDAINFVDRNGEDGTGLADRLFVVITDLRTDWNYYEGEENDLSYGCCTWDMLCTRAEDAAHLSKAMKAKDQARAEMADFSLDMGFGNIEAAECPEDEIEKLCKTYDIRFTDNGSINWSTINGWIKTDDSQYVLADKENEGYFEVIQAVPVDDEYVICEPDFVNTNHYKNENGRYDTPEAKRILESYYGTLEEFEESVNEVARDQIFAEMVYEQTCSFSHRYVRVDENTMDQILAHYIITGEMTEI